MRCDGSAERPLPVRLPALTLGAFAGAVLLAGCGGEPSGQAPSASINAQDASAGSGSQTQGRPAASETSPRAEPRLDRKHPIVEVTTNLGAFHLKLDAENAPLTVDNFLTYVRQGHYDGTIFDQVYRGQGCIGGLYTPEREAKETRTPIRNEADNGLKNRRGTIAMVRAGEAIDSATSHFFVNVADNPNLDHRSRTAEGFGYCVFGTVTQGMDVVDRISQVPVRDSGEFPALPVETVTIESMRRLR